MSPTARPSSSRPRSASCIACGRRTRRKEFHAANERASCAYMKVTTLPKVLAALENLQHRITVPEDIARRAKRAIERMVAIGGGAPAVPSPGVDPGE
ncbi:MAG: quinolinate synthase NadA [Rubrivivax sp.]|nr:quinolinate synthase NadA [Rubrivivax sp.]